MRGDAVFVDIRETLEYLNNHRSVHQMLEYAKDGNLLEVNRLLRIIPHSHIDQSCSLALFHACKNGHVDVVKSLTKRKLNYALQDFDGNTAFVVSVIDGHESIVEEMLLILKRDVPDAINYKTKKGDTALMCAVKREDINIVRMLLQAGVDRDVYNSEGYTPLDIATKNKSVQIIEMLQSSTLHEKEEKEETLTPLAKLWIAALSGTLQKVDVFDYLKSPEIDSMQTIIAVHNLFLVGLRQSTFALRDIQNFQNDTDYITKNIYYPLSEMIPSMSEYEQFVAKRLLQHAENVGFLKTSQAFQIYQIVPDLRMEILERRREVGNVIEKIAVELTRLDQRIYDVEKKAFYLEHRMDSVERWADQATYKINELYRRTEVLAYWTRQATNQFQMLRESHERVAQDVVRLGTSLNKLHGLITKQQRRQFISGILGVGLSLIPFIGSALSSATQAGLEVVMGLSQEEILDITTDTSKSVVNHFLSVDLSNFQTVAALTSEKFISELEPANREPILLLMKNSEFKSIENFRTQLVQTQDILLKDITFKNSEGTESEIESRYTMITMDSKDGTANIRDASKEMSVLCGRRIVNFKSSEKEVKTELRNRHNKKSRITKQAFHETFMHFYELHKKHSKAKVIPPAIGARFADSAHPYQSIDVEDAIPVLQNLYEESGQDQSNDLGFKRTTDDWNEEKVEELFKEHKNDNGNVNQESFIQVALKTLFGRFSTDE